MQLMDSEYHTTQWHPTPVNLNLRPKKLTMGMYALPRLLLGSRDWLRTLISTFETHGFEDVRRIDYPDRPHMGAFWTDMYFSSILTPPSCQDL
jgi:hypothetical protein